MHSLEPSGPFLSAEPAAALLPANHTINALLLNLVGANKGQQNATQKAALMYASIPGELHRALSCTVGYPAGGNQLGRVG